MGTAPAFASVGEAIEMARAALGYLAAVDATQLAAETQAACLRGLERTDAIATAARASFLSAFTAGKGYSADADYSARVWLMHKTGITRGAAASHTGDVNVDALEDLNLLVHFENHLGLLLLPNLVHYGGAASCLSARQSGWSRRSHAPTTWFYWELRVCHVLHHSCRHCRRGCLRPRASG
jgi:hypothetical protein